MKSPLLAAVFSVAAAHVSLSAAGPILDIGLPEDAAGATPRDLNNLGAAVGYSSVGDFKTLPWLWQNGSFTRLPLPAGVLDSIAYAINDSGLIVGGYVDPTLQNGDRACSWQNGIFATLTLPPDATGSAAFAVNSSSTIVGYYIDQNGATRACSWQNGVLTTLPIPPGAVGSTASAVTDSGLILGNYNDNHHPYAHACFWKDGVFTNLPGVPLPGNTSYSQAFAANSSGLVVGRFQDEIGKTHAGSWQNGVLTVLPVPAGVNFSQAVAVSESGLILGWFQDENYHLFACVWQNGVFANLTPEGTTYSAVSAVNAAGLVVGKYGSATGYHAFTWQDGVFTDLNTADTLAAGWQLRDALLLNDSGQILGGGVHPDNWHLFLTGALAPTPTPTPTVEPDSTPAPEVEPTATPTTEPTATPVTDQPMVTPTPLPVAVTESGSPRPIAIPAPRIDIRNEGKAVTTRDGTLPIRGTAANGVTSVIYRVGKGPWKKASGTKTWKLNASNLQPGRNIVTVIARGSGGDSDSVKITVIRK